MAAKSSKKGHSRIANMVTGSGRQGNQGKERTADRERIPVVDSESLARSASTVAAYATATLIKQRMEAGHTRIQRIFGTSVRRRAEEQLTIMIGSQIAGTAAALAAAGARAGAQRHRDRKVRLENARKVRQVIGLAAMASEGSMTEESGWIYKGAMEWTGLTNAELKRIEAEPLPASISDLDSCTLQEPLLSAVAIIAFCAMAAASSATQALQRAPSLLLPLGLPRPTAEAVAQECFDVYVDGHVVVSDHYPLLRPEATAAALQFHLPLSQNAAAAQMAIAGHPAEQARQAKGEALAAVVRHASQAALESGVQLPPAVNIVARIAGQLSGQQTSAPAQKTTSAYEDDSLPLARSRTRAQGEIER